MTILRSRVINQDVAEKLVDTISVSNTDVVVNQILEDQDSEFYRLIGRADRSD